VLQAQAAAPSEGKSIPENRLSSPNAFIGDPDFKDFKALKAGFPIKPSGMTSILLVATWY
jgi:hypothetical protein